MDVLATIRLRDGDGRVSLRVRETQRFPRLRYGAGRRYPGRGLIHRDPGRREMKHARQLLGDEHRSPSWRPPPDEIPVETASQKDAMRTQPVATVEATACRGE